MRNKHKKQRNLNYVAIFLKARSNGWTQRRIAAHIGKSRTSICFAFRGTRPNLLPLIDRLVSKPYRKAA